MGYAFNWSPEGVVNEYLNDCEVIEDGVRKMVSSMEWNETIYVDGVMLEAFTTSGGLGTICETYHGKVANIDYKSMRYPGHMRLMNFFFHELLMRERRSLAGEILTNAKPPVNDDIVYVHVSAEGNCTGGCSGENSSAPIGRSSLPAAPRQRSRGPPPRRWSPWSRWSATAPCRNRGFLKQEEIPLANFLADDHRPLVPVAMDAASRTFT